MDNTFIFTENQTILYQEVTIGSNPIIEPYAILGIQDRFHPLAKLIIGDNAFIGSRCTIYAGVTIGNNFDISDQSSVFYDNEIGDDCRIGPKAVIKNGCRIGDNVRINSQVFLERVIIGSYVFVGPVRYLLMSRIRRALVTRIVLQKRK